MKFETVIGLEIHVELATKTKIFCNCENVFGGEENTHCCPVCLGLPGSLPVMNQSVVDYAARVGLALGCEVAPVSYMDRKNYHYPDLPKGYQISQRGVPICSGGQLNLVDEDGTPFTIGFTEIHMEEDAGKLIHDEWEDCSLVDYNRSGVPLIEIVSEPDMRSSEEVIAYLEKLRCMMQYLGVSDCKLQEGSMRADVNLSVREVGAEEFGTRTEMKNLNSFKAIARAIENETERQIDLIESGEKVIQETRRWDDVKEYSYAMRSKEDAQDYRYFPDPDLVPVIISEEWLDEVKSREPEFRDEKMARYISEFELPEYDADIITLYKPLADLFEETVALGNKPKEVSNWIMGETMRLCKEESIDPDQIKFSAANLSKLIKMIEGSVINRGAAKEVFEEMFKTDVDPEKYVEEHGMKQDNDEDALREIVQKVIEENPKAVEDVRSGKGKAIGALVGQTMKATKGKANPAVVNKLLKELI